MKKVLSDEKKRKDEFEVGCPKCKSVIWYERKDIISLERVVSYGSEDVWGNAYTEDGERVKTSSKEEYTAVWCPVCGGSIEVPRSNVFRGNAECCACNGRGCHTDRLFFDDKECPYCDGEGKRVRGATIWGKIIVEDPCLGCDGTGKKAFTYREVCKKCDGYGYMYDDIEKCFSTKRYKG